MLTSSVRYGLHSHGQYVDFKEECVHGPSARSQTNLTTSNGAVCDFSSVISSSMLSPNVSQLLIIMGFSAYPDSMTSTDINFSASEEATLGRLNKTLSLLQGYAEILIQGLSRDNTSCNHWVCDYGTSYTYAQARRQQAHTKLMWDVVEVYNSLLRIQW